MNGKAALLFLAVFLVGTAAGAVSEDYASELITRARSLKLSDENQWIKLVHYRKSIWGGYRGEADGEKFYLDPQGRDSPEAELEADIHGFFGPDVPDTPSSSHPQCQFPARYMWLKQRLSFDPLRLPEKHCARFNEYKERLSSRSATLVFSSYYMNSPSSTFGHTFLRLNKGASPKDGKRYELLDFGIGYGANADTSNPVLYAFKGMFGRFTGTFTGLPYYYKVREYNDSESRDLWEYDLSLSQPEIDLLVAHTWELGWTHFNYYYLTKNCSYHILAALDAAKPDLNLIDRLAYYVIPTDSVKVVYDTPGLVTRVHYRPSLRSVFNKRLEQLDPEDKVILTNAIATKAVPLFPTGFDIKRQARVLDSSIDYIDYKYNKDLVFNDPMPGEWKQKLLVARARLGIPSESVVIEPHEEQMPQNTHPSSRAGIETGVTQNNDAFFKGHIRFALHDLADPGVGYPRSQIEFLDEQFRYSNFDKSFWLEDFALFRLTSLSELEMLDKPVSWRGRLGATTVRDSACNHCTAGIFEGGAGLTFGLAKWISFYVFGDAEVSGSGLFHTTALRFGAGPAAGLRFQLAQNLVLHSEALKRFFLAPHDLDNMFAVRTTLRWNVFRRFSLNAEVNQFPDYAETSAGVFYYF